MNINGYPLDYYGNEYKHFIARVENIYPNGVPGGDATANQVQIRIFGQQDMDFKIDDLPWAFVVMPTTSGSATGAGSVHGLQHSDLVVGFWLDPEMQIPCVTGVITGGPDFAADVLITSPPSAPSSAAAPASSQQQQQKPKRTPDPVEEPNVEKECEIGDMTSQGIDGSYDNKAIPATLRHNNPLGINTSAGAPAYNPRGSQTISGNNPIASFNSTVNGYGYAIGQLAFNASRNGQVDSNGRLYTTPQLAGDQWQTPGYNGTTLVNAIGNNDRLYFDEWSSGWDRLLVEMENRETAPALRNKVKANNSCIPATYDWGQNPANKEAGFNMMRSVRGI